MFNTNEFKRQVKEWMRKNPDASLNQMQDYCESLIPAVEYQSYEWLVEQTTHWYSYVLSNREKNLQFEEAVE